MRALAGPAMLLVLFGGFAIYKLTSRASGDTPSREFTELELAANDADHTGTCYSLSTVLIASNAYGRAVLSWSAPEGSGDEKWLLMRENVIQGMNGPVREFQEFTFERFGEQVRLVAVDASEGLPTDPGENIDLLLADAHSLGSTPVDRCHEDGGTGYQFPPKK